MHWYVLGTRPELIKAWPIVQQARAEGRDLLVVSTGQHTSLAEGMPLTADVNLGVAGMEDPYATVTAMARALQAFAEDRTPTSIIVQGDTSSALAGARFAESRNLPLLHVEAGLRSHDKADPWPEEEFRVEMDRLATRKACPTDVNYANLAREGLATGAEVTGNPITDALRLMGARKQAPEHVLITLHRRESFGADMHACAKAIFKVAWRHRDIPFLWPLHPNPHVREAVDCLYHTENVQIVPPMSYEAFLKALCRAHCVITDSGGLVEECTTLGIPCLVARNHTERPEALAGECHLVGRDGARLDHYDLTRLHCPPLPLFGDGFTAPRITRMLP